MNERFLWITTILLLFSQMTFAQTKKTDANIFGHVTCNHCDEHLAFATVSVKGTTIGTTTDETGHYQLIDLPVGTHILQARSMGHIPLDIEVTIRGGETMEVNFELQKDMRKVEEVIVTGNRNETNRKESPTIVNTIKANLFSTTQSVTLSEGLNFSPGLRMENNCQNCGFSQLRMNGMEGAYSQVLINSRPIFSGLAGVYGLELIPANMIERVEVIRGGGSALYGSNAIAGTINLILKDPIKNAYAFEANTGVTGTGMDDSGDPARDHVFKFNTSLISSDNKTGMALYGFYRERDPFDANNDGFSELSSIENTTLGTRFYHRFGLRSKVSVDLFRINEDRRGGDRFDYPLHEANIAEAVDHKITTGALTYEKFFREIDLFSVYFSAQNVDRDSYYGAEKSLSDYGHTVGLDYVTGAQYNANFDRSELIVGLENKHASLNDRKLGYPDIENAVIQNDSVISVPSVDNLLVADQVSNTFGAFAQYQLNFDPFQFSAGARFDRYRVDDKKQPGSEKTGNVLSPRLTFKYDIRDYLQARVSYSQGYRAPQIFDEDLHIETSGSRQVIHKNSPDLRQETSHSYLASLDYNDLWGEVYVGLLVEGFYTQLKDPFSNEFSTPDENGVVTYTRFNAAGGANVQGVNLEMNVVPGKYLSVKSGFTWQKSQYDEEQQFNETRFFRTPKDYGYVAATLKPSGKWAFSATGNYTGKMLVPYFGLNIPDPAEGELRESSPFFDPGLKLRYYVKLNGATMELYSGVKNVFNAYQNDFDRGINRDPGYIYGPMTPRSIYFGIKIGN